MPGTGWAETARGTIIGGEEEDHRPIYQFFTLEGKKITEPGRFACDKEAIAWFRENHPEYSSVGAEMRSWFEAAKGATSGG